MTALGTTRPSGGAARARARLVALVGGLLLVSFSLQVALRVQWPGLEALQAKTSFKLVTGTTLAAFICFQWLLSLSRIKLWMRSARTLYTWHQAAGALAPVLLFLHSVRLGFGYIFVLSSIYLLNNLLGLINPTAFSRLKRAAAPWMIAHIALSVLLVVLTAYHGWTALYYE